MLKLNLQKEPYWLDLVSNVRLRVKPLTSALMYATQHSITKQINHLREANQLPEDESQKFGVSELLFIKALAKNAILEWEGVLIANGTKVAEVTDDNVDALLDVWIVAQDFWKKYYADSLTLLESEGNLSGLSSSGTSEEGLNTASAVKNKNCRAAKVKRIRKQASSVHT